MNPNQLRGQGAADRACGVVLQTPVIKPCVEDVTALIRKLDLTVGDCETLLFVIASRLVKPLEGMTLAQLHGNPLMRACEILDEAADELSNIKVPS
jgi:hypothetical protein